MSYGLAALISWLATAGVGGILLYLWAVRAVRSPRRGRLSYGRPPPYIPRWMVIAHVTLAVAGLVAWVGAIAFIDQLAYAALAALAGVALLGASMFVRWLGSRRARRAALALNRAPSESRIPTLAVISHGLLGVTTMVLVLLSFRS